MFYDKDLMNNPSLSCAWKAANNLDHDLNTVSVPNICATLDSWVSSDHEDGRKRLSLRTSSLFLNGTAKLYKRKLQQLFDDVENLDNEMAFRNKIRCSSTSQSAENSSDQSSKSVEENRDVDKSSRKENAMESSKTYNTSTSPTFTVHDESALLEETPEEISPNQYPDKDDKANQTSPVKRRSNYSTELEPIKRRSNYSEFDENLPFGYTIVHDSYKSRVPSKIILSSLNVNIYKLN